MKIALLYNPSAGRRVALGWLRKQLERQGHEIVRVVEHNTEMCRLADSPAELVVAAGGDGTIAAAARAIAGTAVPMALLPLGTANNVAFTLGVTGPIARLAAAWHSASPQPLDLGVARGAWGERRFIEGVGVGLVPACLAVFEARPVPRHEPPPSQLVRALRRYREALERLRPRAWSLTVDGDGEAGDYLLIEALNARAVGPNLELAPAASPSDGALSVVTAREEHREALAAYVDDRLAGRDARLALPVTLARRVEIRGPGACHIDDELLDDAAVLALEVEPAAVRILVPPA